MDTNLEKINYEDMRTIKVDKLTCKLLEELIGIDKCCYDWWEMSQGVKDLVIGLKLLSKIK